MRITISTTPIRQMVRSSGGNGAGRRTKCARGLRVTKSANAILVILVKIKRAAQEPVGQCLVRELLDELRR